MLPNRNIQHVQAFPASFFFFTCCSNISFFSLLYLFSPFLLKPTVSVFHFNCSLFQCVHVKSSCGSTMKAVLLNVSVDVIAFLRNPINTGSLLIPSLCGELLQLCSEASICSAANFLDGTWVCSHLRTCTSSRVHFLNSLHLSALKQNEL